ncbi:MAG: GxxExxY protein [Candidatus Thermoplasmatota archaeon]
MAYPPITPISPNEPDRQTYAIIGAALEVHRTLGSGFLERVYQQALAREFALRGIPFEREVELPIPYKGEPLDCLYKIDFLCYGEVLVELKALSSTGGVEEAQVLNYLKASRLDVALLLNFGAESLRTRRFAMSRNASAQSA